MRAIKPARTPWLSTGYANASYLEMEPKSCATGTFTPGKRWGDPSPRAWVQVESSAARVVRNIAPDAAESELRSTWRDAPGTGQAFFTHGCGGPAAVDPAAHGLPGGRRGGRDRAWASPSRRDRAGQCRGVVVAPRAGRQPDRRRRRCGDRRRGRRFDRLLDRPPLRLTAIRPAGPEVPKTLRPRSCRAC